MARVYPLIAKVAGVYDKVSSLIGYNKSVQLFVDALPFSESDKINILEVGCGTGIYTEYLVGKFKNCTVYAFDSNSELVEHLNRKLHKYQNKVNIFTADLNSNLPELPDNYFDLVIAAGVLEYVDITATIVKLSRFLKEEGIFLSVPVRDTLWGKLVCLVYGCRPYSKNSNVVAFVENGFELMRHVELPCCTPASFKEAYIFKKTKVSQSL